jgi:hypothetical protein
LLVLPAPTAIRLAVKMASSILPIRVSMMNDAYFPGCLLKAVMDASASRRL